MNAQILAENCRGLRTAFPNVLLIGADARHDRALAELLDTSRPPVWHCDGARFALPAESVGTLLLRNPTSLRAGEQRALLNWATNHVTVQIITVTPTPLYPLVQAATFLDDLYYWLNVVTLTD